MLVAGSIVALVEALIVMLVLLGVVELTTEQTGAIMAFAAAFIAIVAPPAAAFWARSKVFPLSKLDPEENNE